MGEQLQGDDERKRNSNKLSSGGVVMKKSYFDVLGLCCSSEIPLVENILKQLDGVKDVSVIVASRTVIVIHDTHLVSPTHIVNALNQARLEANIKVRGQSNQHQHKWPSPYAIASGTLLLLSFLKFVYHPLRWLALGAVAAGILPIAWKGLAAARNFRIDINILVIVAVAGTIAMHDYLEAGTIVFLFNIAEWLESRASHKATAEMSSLMSIAPQKAEIAETGEVVDVDEVELHTVVAVKAGEIIPIDGIVVDGRSEVDEKTMTGESFPVSKQKDSTVWAGTINLNGYITIRTTALAEECVVAKMAKLVEEAQNNKSKTQRIVDKCAKYYTPAILVGAIGLAVIPLCFGFHNKDYWFHLSLVVLVSSCPCALVLSTPVATFCALTKAAKSGILIKGGDYLETLAKIKTVAFDKTGTITKGEFVVVDFQSLSREISVETLLYWVSSVESKSSHPLAIPLVQYGRSLGIEPKTEDVMDFQNYPGEGVYGSIDGKDVFIGNKRLATKAGCETALNFEGGVKGGKTVGYVFVGPTLVGIFSLSDECRTGVVEAITKLKLMKIRTAMLTGDNQEAALHAQNQINNALDLVHAELLPEDKSKIIEVLKRDGKTVMVGDGINDAPALATADIGISMGISGSALATETGHIVLMSNDIRKIPSVISLARRARRTVIVNVVLSISTKAAILALAFAGHPLVWAAVLADTGTCIVVILNSMLLLREPHKHAHHGHEHTHKHGSKSVGKKDRCCSKKNASSGQDHEHGHKHGSNCVTKTDRCCSKKNASSGQDHEHGHKHGSNCVTKTDRCCSNKNVLSGQNQEHGHCNSKENMCNLANTEHLNHEHHHHHHHHHLHHLESHKISCEPSICAGKVTCNARNSTSSNPAHGCHQLPNSNKKQGCCSGSEKCGGGSSDGINHLIEICNTIDGCSKGDASSSSSNHSENHHHVEVSCQKNLQCVSKPACASPFRKGHCDHDSCENHIHERKSEHCLEDDIEMGQCDDIKDEMQLHGCCSSLEKREIGGCCKSFIKECHHQHLSHGFGGQLTVVTE